MKKTCFTPSACGFYCPNAAIDAYDERYGGPLAEDLGYKKVPCSECMYNTGCCTDCLFKETEYCDNKKEGKS